MSVRKFAYRTNETAWSYAKYNDYVIFYKDSDFHQRNFLYGFPPKVIWLRLGNCCTERIVSVLKEKSNEILFFELDREAAFLVIHPEN